MRRASSAHPFRPHSPPHARFFMGIGVGDYFGKLKG